MFCLYLPTSAYLRIKYLSIFNGLRRPCLLGVQYLQVILSSLRLLCSSTSARWCWCRIFFCYFLNLLFYWIRFIIVISNRCRIVLYINFNILFTLYFFFLLFIWFRLMIVISNI